MLIVIGHVKNGVVIPTVPLDLPDGSEVEVHVSNAVLIGAEPNEEALAMLRDVAEITKDMRETDGSRTIEMIREARAGGMYGL